MPSPWDDKQKPHEKSPHHGKRDKDDGAGPGHHGKLEHGLGGQIPPGRAKKEAEDPDVDEEVVAGAVLAGVTYPSFLYIPNRPPITNQGTSSRCVSHYSASDQNQHDRPDFGHFFDFDIAKFATRIGTTSAGAFLNVANDERVNRGYPIKGIHPEAFRHKIRRAVDVAESVSAIKAAYAFQHGIGMLMPWFHSWYHPLASGKLPAPDYLVGYHMIFGDGYNDNLGVRLANSWGTDWGAGGRCFLPYAQIWRARAIQRTVDL